MLLDLLESRDPRSTVLYQNNRPFSASEMATRARALAGALAARGVVEGDRVALVLPNCKELVLALVACARLGAVAAPIDCEWTAPELARALVPLAPRVALVLGRRCEAFLAAVEASGIAPPVLVRIDQDAKAQGADRAIFLDELVESRLPVPARPPERAVFLAHATWRGRGVPHFALIEGARAIEGALAVARASGIERSLAKGPLLAAAPFVRADALTASVLAPLALGAPFVVLKHLRARMALRLAHAHGVAVVVAPPALLALMARFAHGPNEPPLGGVTTWLSAAAPPPDPAQVELVEKTFGSPLIWGYGPAEAPWTLVVTEARRSLPPASRGPGEPVGQQVHVTLVENGSPVPEGAPGFLHVSAPWAARELLGGAPSDEPSTIFGAPTGDRALRTKDGQLHLGPRDDLANVAAYEVDLGEVVNALLEHPSVATASAHAIPDPESGSHILAVVALAPGTEASVSELVEFLKKRLAYYKIPQAFRFRKVERPA